MNQECPNNVGAESVIVIPVGPKCQRDFVVDTIESVRFYAPMARIVIVDDSRRPLGAELGELFQAAVVAAPAHGLYGSLYLNLSAGFKEALNQPFKILLRLDTDALIAGDDFEKKAIEAFQSDLRLGSLGSFRIGYNRVGVRNSDWAKRRIIAFLAFRSWRRPRAALVIARLIYRAHRNGYKFGDAIMGGAAIYRYEAVVALRDADLLGRTELTQMGLQEDYIFGICLFALGFQLGEFGDKYNDLPMGVAWKSLPASPRELTQLGKSIIHSTKGFESMDEETIRREFRSARHSRVNRR